MFSLQPVWTALRWQICTFLDFFFPAAVSAAAGEGGGSTSAAATGLVGDVAYIVGMFP